MTLRYIDLHCDTAYELYHQNQSILTNTLAISLDKVGSYVGYAQFFAVWSDRNRSDDEAYADFLAISDDFTARLNEPSIAKHICMVRTARQMQDTWAKGKCAAFLAVEDARLLGGKLERLEALHERGVKYLTLLWGGSSCIGGSHDTPHGLTDFGKEVVKACFSLGIVPDISHASEQSAQDVLTLAEQYGRPIIASHSNFFSVYPHSRNLRDDHFKRLCALGGVVGLNLCREHVCHKAEYENVLRHLEHALSLGGEGHLAIGGDLDGATLVDGIGTVSDVAILAKAMADHGYSQDCIDRIFYANAQAFIEKNFDQA